MLRFFAAVFLGIIVCQGTVLNRNRRVGTAYVFLKFHIKLEKKCIISVRILKQELQTNIQNFVTHQLINPLQILDSHNWCCNVPVDPVIRNVTTTSLEPKNVTRVVNTTYERTCEFGEQPTSADGWKCADTVTHVMYVNRANIHEREITRVRYNLSFKIFGRFGKLNKPQHYSNVL